MAPTPQPVELIDTDILIDAFRGVNAAHTFLANQQAGPGVSISIISAMELVVGCRNTVELRRVQQFLQAVVIVPLTEPVSQRAFQFIQSFFLSHGLLVPDALIAATAVERGMTLYTKNLRHFQTLPGLTLVRPY